VLIATSSTKEKFMSSYSRMIRIATITLDMLEDMAVAASSDQTRSELRRLRKSIVREKEALSRMPISSQEIKLFEDKVRAILNEPINVAGIDIDAWDDFQ
jgi:hypothetical protein